jgi:hypothetical protein
MPIAITCSKCNRKYQVREELAGKTAKCQCGQPIPIPQPPPSAPAPAPAPSAGVASLFDDENFGAAAADPFAGIPDDPSCQGSPLQPLPAATVRRKKSSLSVKISPNMLKVLIVGLLVCAAIGGAVYFVMQLTAPRWKTPEAVFEASRQSFINRDWRMGFETLAPEQQKAMVKDIASGIAMGAEEVPAIAGICKDFGLTPLNPKEMAGNFTKIQELQKQNRETIDRMSASKQADLFVAVMKMITDEKQLPSKVAPIVAMLRTKLDEVAEEAKSGTLSDVHIEGDRAIGKVKYTAKSFGKSIECNRTEEFVKVNGEWRCGNNKPR